MELTKEMLRHLENLGTKEQILSELIVWLKAKGYWDECCRDIMSLSHLHPKIGVPA